MRPLSDQPVWKNTRIFRKLTALRAFQKCIHILIEDVSRSGTHHNGDVWIICRIPVQKDQAVSCFSCRAGLTADQVGVCLVATFTADTCTPSAACVLQADLGMPEDTLCFDLNAACAGFVYGLHVAECLLPGAKRPYALVVGTDTLSRVMDFTDRTTCVLFGDGAGAAVLECREDYPQLYAVWGSRGDDASLYAPGVGCDEPSYLHMDGRAVFRFATEVMPRATKEVLDAAGITADEVDRFVYHQANKRIVDYSVKKLGLDPAKCEGNIDHMGNTSAGSVPILLDELVRAGKIVPGNRVLMAGFGAGLTWAGALAELA